MRIHAEKKRKKKKKRREQKGKEKIYSWLPVTTVIVVNSRSIPTTDDAGRNSTVTDPSFIGCASCMYQGSSHQQLQAQTSAFSSCSLHDSMMLLNTNTPTPTNTGQSHTSRQRSMLLLPLKVKLAAHDADDDGS